jgi:phosphoribosylamine--glycine ligase
VISGYDADGDSEDCKIFHAGTRTDGDHVVTNGGRVLCATALGNNVTQAQARAYALVEQVSWEDMYYRKDIGYRAVERESIKG